MTDPRSTYSRLISVDSRHPKIAQKFAEFSKLVNGEIADGKFAIDGITFESYLSTDLFSVLFAGTTIVFALSISASSEATTLGRVTCFSKRSIPTEEFEEIGSFTFKVDGETSERDVQPDGRLYLDDPYGASFIAMRFLCLAMLK